MTVPHFTPRQLDAFIAAAELNNFTQTANRLHLSPSAVSNLINELEAALGFAVFERTTRKVVLTADGREFLPAAMAVQRQISLAATRAADIRDRSVDVVRVATPMSVGSFLLPPLIAEHRRAQPRVTVRIVDTGVEWLADRVAAGEADIALGPDRLVGPDVVRESLFPSPWVVWFARGHPLAAKDALSWKDLHGVDFYAAGRDHEHSVRPRILGHPDAEAVVPIQIVDNISTAFGIVAAGLGVTCSPAYVGQLAQAFGLVCRPLVDPEVIRFMSIYTPAERKLGQAAIAFSERLRTGLLQSLALPTAER